jgi:NitT/TauT family transport system ATP-binding protein
LEEINFEAKEGEFLCLVGPSGCGKSTLLNIIAGLQTPDQGRVWMNGEEVRGPGTDRIVIFQDAGLFPWLNVRQNVEYGLKIAGVSPEQRHQIAVSFLKMVHLSRFAESYVHELSGGMRQRVAIARALAMNPKALLLDEPFAALDSQTRDVLSGELQDIWARTKKTIIFVTHNVREAVCLGDRVLVLSSQPGRIKRELCVTLPRPRSLHSVEVGELASLILKELREEIERVMSKEMDSDWSTQKSDLFDLIDRNLGSGI